MILALLNHLWQSTLFAATVGLLTVTLAKHGAHVRYGLWYAASLKFLLPFSLLVSLGSHIVWTRSAPLGVATLLDHVIEPFAAVSPVLPAGSMKVAAAVAGSTDHLHDMANAPALLWTSLWAGGALVVMMRWLMQWLRIRAAVKCSELLPLAAPIVVRSSQAGVEPGVVGLFRPILLLPARIAEQLRPEQLQAIVAHELCHVRRRDNLAAALHMLVEAVFWFYPLVWWLGRRLVAEREFACDEAVIAAGNDREAYATGIVQVCRHYLESPLICASGVSGADLKSRIERIMAQGAVSKLTLPRKALLALLACVSVITPVAFGAVSSAPLPREGKAQHGEADELRDLLTQSQFTELDRRMNGYQGAYESHVLNEDGLLRVFAAFDVADPALEAKLNGWVAAFPRSYAAHLARGGYYFVCGTQTRGTRDVAHTTPAQLNGMRFYYGKAQKDLKDSLAIDAKPLLSYNLLIRIEMESGTQQAARSFLNAALKIDPNAMSVRRAYMRSLQTRWGGSLNEMLAFMQETRMAGFSDDQLWTLEKLIDEERRWLARYEGGKQ